ncbi:hypothetical protein [Rhizobium sp. RCC_161_2]|uniref:hypothetical protein n=1 Tax=Rhizobium sp. RCC_161_2 TaxID=3239219 RepID=UPI003524975B
MRIISRRLAAGVVIAPLPSIVIATFFFRKGLEDHISLWDVFLPLAAIGYAIALILGLPIHLALVLRGWTKIGHYAVAGAILGPAMLFFSDIIGAFITGRLIGVEVDENTLQVLGLMVTFIGPAAIIFWLIVRPDKKSSNTI